MFLFMLEFFGGLLLLILTGWLVGNLLHLDRFYEREENKKIRKLKKVEQKK